MALELVSRASVLLVRWKTRLSHLDDRRDLRPSATYSSRIIVPARSTRYGRALPSSKSTSAHRRVRISALLQPVRISRRIAALACGEVPRALLGVGESFSESAELLLGEVAFPALLLEALYVTAPRASDRRSHLGKRRREISRSCPPTVTFLFSLLGVFA